MGNVKRKLFPVLRARYLCRADARCIASHDATYANRTTHTRHRTLARLSYRGRVYRVELEIQRTHSTGI